MALVICTVCKWFYKLLPPRAPVLLPVLIDITHLLSANSYISAPKWCLFFASNVVFCRSQVAEKKSRTLTLTLTLNPDDNISLEQKPVGGWQINNVFPPWDTWLREGLPATWVAWSTQDVRESNRMHKSVNYRYAYQKSHINVYYSVTQDVIYANTCILHVHSVSANEEVNCSAKVLTATDSPTYDSWWRA